MKWSTITESPRMASIYWAVHKIGGPPGESSLQPQITFEEGRKLMNQNLENILTNSHPWPIRLEGEDRVRNSEFITRSIESFVISHELGHIHHQHHSKPRNINQEFEADEKGYSYYRTLIEDLDPNVPTTLPRELFYTSPFFMFIEHAAIENHILSQGGKVSETHPPSVERIWKLDRVQKKTGDNYSATYLNRFLSFF